MKKKVVLMYRAKQMVFLRKSRKGLGLLVKQAYSLGLTVAVLLLASPAVDSAAQLKVPSPPPAVAPAPKTDALGRETACSALLPYEAVRWHPSRK
jgi:hypothetical protein